MTLLNNPFPPSKANASGYLYLAADGCPTLRIPVDSADMASGALQQYVDRYCIGASDMSAGFGNIYTNDGTLVAKVSFNGRVWSPQGDLLQEPFDCNGQSPTQG